MKLKNIIEASGWICGLAAASIADYFAIPRITKIIGKLNNIPVSLSIGLLLAVIVIFIFLEISRQITNIIYKEAKIKTKAQKREKLYRIKKFLRIGIVSLFITSFVIAGGFILLKTVIEPMQIVVKIKMKDRNIRKINTKKFQTRLRYEREWHISLKKNDINNDRTDDRFEYSIGFAASIIDRMTREVLIDEEAKKRNLAATKEEIDQQGPPIIFSKNLKQYKKVIKELRNIYRIQVLEKKLREAFYNDIPIIYDRVKLKLIRFEFEPDAQQAVDRELNNGNFTTLYNKVKKGMVRGATAVTREWSTENELIRDFNLNFSHIAFDLAAGKHTVEPIEAARGWYFMEVTGHEKQEMTEEWRKARGTDEFIKWFEDQQWRITQFPRWMKRITKPPKDK